MTIIVYHTIRPGMAPGAPYLLAAEGQADLPPNPSNGSWRKRSEIDDEDGPRIGVTQADRDRAIKEGFVILAN